MDDTTHQSDSDALASALGAIGGVPSHHHDDDDETTHHFHHQLQAPDFSSHVVKSPLEHDSNTPSQHNIQQDDTGVEIGDVVDVEGLANLDIPVQGDVGDMDLGQGGEEELDLGMSHMDDMDDLPRTNSYGRPPSIRKACDLCHAAKQKCSGDRPTCTRCAAGGWPCVYAPRQRRRTVPKEQKLANANRQSPPPGSAHMQPQQSHPLVTMKKRKMGHRESVPGGFGSGEMDLKLAMHMAADLGLTGEDEGDELLTMSDDQMLESIAIDGYLADLPLATFVHNLPYTAPPQQDTTVSYGQDDYTSANDTTFPASDMDQHTTSALRDAIFSLNESSGGNAGHGDVSGDGQGDNADAMDPHLALLDLSHAMPQEGEGEESDNEQINIAYGHSSGCSHSAVVAHILSLLTQHTLEPKPGSNTPLTLAVFSPLARSLRLFHALVFCPVCSASPQQTLPQLALLSRTTTILTFPFPPILPGPGGSNAQISIQGAKLTGTGLSEAIEQHIVGVVWDSWRAAIREIFASFERRAQEIIQQSASLNANGGEGQGQGGQGGNGGQGGVNGSGHTGPEIQRAGLMFQAMTRLVTAMDEVEA